MSLSKSSLQSAIASGLKQINAQCSNGDGMTPDQNAEAVATCIANAIDTFVKSGAVSITKSLTAPGEVTLANGGGPCAGTVVISVTDGTIS